MRWGWAILLAGVALAGSANAETMRFSSAGSGGNCSFCSWVAADGEITERTPADFEQFVAQNGCSVVFLNSPGGNLLAGLRLGALIRKHCAGTDVGKTVQEADPQNAHLETIEAGACASACVFSFLGGRERRADPGTLLVHQFYSDAGIMRPLEPVFSQADLSLTQALTGVLVAYVMSMQADARLVTLMTRTPPEELHALDAKELEDLRVNYSEGQLGNLSLELVFGRLDGIARSDSGAQLNLFCADRTLHLQLSIPSPGGRARVGDVKAALGTITLNGVTMEKERVSITWIGGDQILSIELPTELPQVVGSLTWEPDIANAYRQDVMFNINEPAFWEKAALLSRVCRS